MNSNSKAVRSVVPFGSREIEGFLLPPELWTPLTKFGVSKTQSVLLAYKDCDPAQAAKYFTRLANIQKRDSDRIKKLIGKGFDQHPKVTFIEGDVKGRVDLIPLYELIRFLRLCEHRGYYDAEELVDELSSLSAEQVFSDHFGQKFDKEDRQKWARTRQKNKDSFALFTDAVKDYIDAHPELSDGKKQWMYPNCQDAINRALFGKSAKQIRETLQVSDLLRNHYGEKALVNIESVQRLSARLIAGDELPTDAVNKAIALFSYGKVDFNN